jgi:hypothetical protein
MLIWVVYMAKYADTDILLRMPAALQQDIAYLGLEVCG